MGSAPARRAAAAAASIDASSALAISEDSARSGAALSSSNSFVRRYGKLGIVSPTTSTELSKRRGDTPLDDSATSQLKKPKN